MNEDPTMLGPGGSGGSNGAFAAGAMLGDYRIVKLLGSGAMGEVYEAEQVHLGRVYAVKVLPAALSGDERFRERFRQEARTMASLEHPNIVSVHYAGEASGRFFLVMEQLEAFRFSEGENGMAGAGTFGLEKVRHVLQQILQALEYAHAQNIVHRDLKPANLLQSDDCIKVADFGVARVVGEDYVRTVVQETVARSRMGDAETLLAKGSGGGSSDYVGTLHYMAPEVLEGGEADARSDLYAVGVMAYEWLTGRKPVGRYKAASALRRGLNPDWDDWLDALMASEPEDRMPNAGAALDRLPGLHAAGSEAPVRGKTCYLLPLVLLLFGAVAWGWYQLQPDAPDVEPVPVVSEEPEPAMPDEVEESLPDPEADMESDAAGRDFLWQPEEPEWETESVLPPDPEEERADPPEGLRELELRVVALRGGQYRELRRADELSVLIDREPVESYQEGVFTLVEAVAAGRRQVELEHPDYENYRGVIDVEEEGATSQHLILNPKAARFSLEVDGPPEVSVWVGGVQREPSEEGYFELVAEQETPVRLSAPGWRTVATTVNLPPNRSETLRLEMEEIASPVAGEDYLLDFEAGFEMEFVWIADMGTWVGRHAVSNDLFRRILENHDSGMYEGYALNGPQQPVVGVHYDAVREFIDGLQSLLGDRNLDLRLPDIEEAKKIARCGTGRTYPWGDELPPTRGNYGDQAALEVFSWRRFDSDFNLRYDYDDGYAVTAPVGEAARNAWGLHGAGSNVWEWTAELRNGEPVAIGASWRTRDPLALRIDYERRERSGRTEGFDDIGFRLMLSASGSDR